MNQELIALLTRKDILMLSLRTSSGMVY